MKKENVIFVMVLIIFMLIFIYFFGIETFIKIFSFPSLSPLPTFLQELAPFEASVRILSGNTAPLIINLSSDYYVCEGQSLNAYFNVTDNEGGPLRMRIDPASPFFISPTFIPLDPIRKIFDIHLFSLVIDKNVISSPSGYRTYFRIISAVDERFPEQNLSDSRMTRITVIEINNPPWMQTIGVQTVWTHGDDSIFDYQLIAGDIEDGPISIGNLEINLTFLNSAPLFNISNDGRMYMVPNETINLSEVTLPETYLLRLCIKDKGISPTHPDIEKYCFQNGSAIQVCQVFSLTVTDENRPPIITDHNPRDLNFSKAGTEMLYFNITDRDPDETIPDTYWYVNNNLIEYDNMSSFDEFYYTFGCGIDGIHKIKVVSTDGLLNDSIEWNVTVNNVPCPETPGGGGGGAVKKKCSPVWVCEDWHVCQSLESSIDLGVLNGDDYREIKESCRLDFFGDYCGFQIRDCYDIKSCNVSTGKPEALQHCYFVAEPSCSDGVNNCHDNSCEILTDCGGPCPPCPTCSDGIKNQGEGGVDCGGPCPFECKIIQPGRFDFLINYLIWIILLLLLLLIVIIIILIYRINKERMKIKNNTPSPPSQINLIRKPSNIDSA